jgi:glyoxylase-like metal-dependent hydrolase (beta-lactamase superfamily II)
MVKKRIVPIVENIWGILPDEPDSEDCNIYVFKHDNHGLLIDAGFEETLDETIQCLHKIGLPLTAIQGILITHAHIDHVGALSKIKQESGCWFAGSLHTKQALQQDDGPLILAHPHNRTFHPIELDRVLQDNDSISFGPFSLTAYSSPGHTIDSISYYEADHELLFSGDTILCDGGIGFVINPTGDLPTERVSIQRLAQLSVKALLPGHRRIELHQGAEQVQKSLEFALNAPTDHGSQYYEHKPDFKY